MMLLSKGLLATKLYIPRPRPVLVLRPRLLTRLEQCLQHRLTLISAIPGAGKTTLLSAWRAENGRHVPLAWVSLDEADNDPARFLSYIVDALETLYPTVGDDVRPLLHSFPIPPLESVLTVLLNALAARSTEDEGEQPDFALVLDDYHVIENEAIHASMTFLLEHMPPQMHIILLTRADPPLPLARLRVRGQLTEIRTQDLRFTTTESFEFLNQTMKLHLSAEDARTLTERTEGWIAGLQLAALSMQGHEDSSELVQAFNSDHHHLVDYLAQEVLERQPLAIQQFLLQTSLLQRLSADLCASVTEQEDTSALIRALEKSNLFLIALDQERQWYRYHSLFRDFLLHTLKRTQAPEFVQALHRRAALWYEQHEALADAIYHLLSAHDYEHAARLIEQQARSLWMHGESVTLRCWLRELPEELVRTRPQLALFFAWSLIASDQVVAARKHIDDAERALVGFDTDLIEQSTPDSSGALADLLAELTILRATVARFEGDRANTIALSQRAIELLPPIISYCRVLQHSILVTPID